jgi:pilus assembly protein Flp/PilA
MSGLLRFLHDEEGASAIEYALIAGLMAAAIVGALEALDLTNIFESINTTITTALSGG